MLKITAGEISKSSKLSVKDVLKHLNSRALEFEKYCNSKYYIDEAVYDKWLKNIPDLKEIEKKSIFIDSTTDDCNHKELYEEHKFTSLQSFLDYKKININSRYTFADLFCGCGGLSSGFISAGFRPVEFIDIFEDALETYYKNNILKFGFIVERNIKERADITDKNQKQIIIERLKKHKTKVICGGFPCQGFSISGTGVATDPRNTLYLDMLDIVKEVNPQYIVMENVMGITSLLEGRVLSKIIKDYESIGYKITYKILNSMNYGVAQSRQRVIFIGNRMGKKNIFPANILVDDFISVFQCIEKYGNEEDKSINHFFSKHSEEMKKRLANVPIGGHLYENYSDSWRKTDPNKPSCTIKENHGATNIHYKFPRTMSPREIAALQSFSDDFIFCGTKASMLKQIGNAVPPLLAKAIALSIKKCIR